MDTSVATDYEGILDLVRGWPSEKRLELVRDILATIQPYERLHGGMQHGIEFSFMQQLYSGSFGKYIKSPEESHMFGDASSSKDKVLLIVLDRQNAALPETSAQPRRKHTLEKALGLLATDHPAPSDAEVEEWLEQRRTEKYG